MLAFCLKGFKKFTHRCPKCNTVIGITEPQLTRKDKNIIGGTVAGIAALIIGTIILLHLIITIDYYYYYSQYNSTHNQLGQWQLSNNKKKFKKLTKPNWQKNNFGPTFVPWGTWLWVSSWLPIIVDYGLSWFILIFIPVFMALPKPMRTEFGIHQRLQSCRIHPNETHKKDILSKLLLIENN